MAGVHRRQQVEHSGREFRRDDAVRTHAQGVDDQVANGDRLALEVRRAGFERQPMRLLQPSSAASSMVITRSPGSIILLRALSMVVLPEPVPPEIMTFIRQAPGDLEAGRHLLRHRAEAAHHVERDRLFGEFTNGDGGARRRRRDNDVDAAAVLEAGVGQRRGLVDAAADLVDDALGDLEQMLLVAELDLASSSLPLRSMKVWSVLTMISLTAGSASSSGPRPSNSSTSTFSSANCSRRLSVIFSSASTSPMIGGIPRPAHPC